MDQVFDIMPSAENPRNSEGDTVLLTDGRLLLAWSRFEGAQDHARAEVAGMTTADWGKHWSEIRTLVSPQEAQLNVMSVSLLREAGSGDLLLFYLRKNSLAECLVYLRRSRDEGQSWEVPQRVATKEGYHVMNNARVIQLHDGRLLAPVAWTRDFATSRHQVAFCYLSDDGGKSWRAGRGMVDLPSSAVGCQEPGLVELSSGILMYIRTDQGYVYGALSRDGGETWSDPWPFASLPSPAAPATMVRLPDGGLVVFYNHRPEGAKAGWKDRTPLAVARSDDEGRTWRRLADLEPSPEFCYAYTSCRIYGDKAVLTYYVWPRAVEMGFEQTRLRFRVLPWSRFS